MNNESYSFENCYARQQREKSRAEQTVPPESSGSPDELVELAQNVLKEFQPYHQAICETGSVALYVTEYDPLWHQMNALRDYLENDKVSGG